MITWNAASVVFINGDILIHHSDDIAISIIRNKETSCVLYGV